MVETGRMGLHLASQSDFDAQHAVSNFIGCSRHLRGNLKENIQIFIRSGRMGLIITIDFKGDSFADDRRYVVGRDAQINGHHLAGHSV